LLLLFTSCAKNDDNQRYFAYHIPQDRFDSMYKERPLMRENWDKPGSYEVVGRFTKTNINKGEILKLEVYVTGYGNIKGAKIFIMPTYDPDQGKIISILGLDTNYDRSTGQRKFFDYDGAVYWGNDTTLAPNEANNFSIVTLWKSGKSFKEIHDTTSFFDMHIIGKEDERNLEISTERKLRDAPITFIINTDGIKPDDYKVLLCLTYFNGQEWKASRQELSFKILNNWERLQLLWWIIGIVIAIIFGVLSSLPGLYESIDRWKKKKEEKKSKKIIRPNK